MVLVAGPRLTAASVVLGQIRRGMDCDGARLEDPEWKPFVGKNARSENWCTKFIGRWTRDPG